jgi:hypothetical protein
MQFSERRNTSLAYYFYFLSYHNPDTLEYLYFSNSRTKSVEIFGRKLKNANNNAGENTDVELPLLVTMPHFYYFNEMTALSTL